MMTVENSESINAIREEDLVKVNSVLYELFQINIDTINRSLADHKESLIESFTELLKKILLQNPEIANESKLNVINLLDKLHTQKEHLENIRSKITASDIHQASKRLSKKSQSAFQLK